MKSITTFDNAHLGSRPPLIRRVTRIVGEMPDAYENYDIAMRSMLTTGIIADNEDSFFHLNGNAGSHVRPASKIAAT